VGKEIDFRQLQRALLPVWSKKKKDEETKKKKQKVGIVRKKNKGWLPVLRISLVKGGEKETEVVTKLLRQTFSYRESQITKKSH